MIAWCLYIAGHVVYMGIEQFDLPLNKTYQWLMAKSAVVQGNGDGPWDVLESIDDPPPDG